MSLFAPTASTGGPSLFNTAPTQQPAASGGGLFSNPTTTSTQPTQSGSLFGGPATTTPAPTVAGGLFGGVQTPQKPNLFAGPTTNPTGTNPSTSLFQNAPVKPTMTATTLGGTGSLFGPSPSTSLGMSMGLNLGANANPNSNPNAGTLFAGSTLANLPNAPQGLFKSSVMPQDVLSFQEQAEKQRLIESIMSYQRGTMKMMFGSYPNSLKLPSTNTLRNTKVKVFDNDNFKNIIISLMEKFVQIQKSIPELTENQQDLLNLLQNYNNLIIEKMKLYKESFLEATSFFSHVGKIQETLDDIDKLVFNEFRIFIQSIKSGKSVYVSRPSQFELDLSRTMLAQARSIFQEVTQYSSCENRSDSATPHYSQVISSMIQYFKNVNCLVYQFKSKYSQVQSEILRRRGGSVRVDVEEEFGTPLQRKTEKIFSRLESVEKSIDSMSERLKSLKVKYREDMDRINKK